MTLRSRLIEAAERVLAEWFGPNDADDPIAANLLDAFLDVLEATLVSEPAGSARDLVNVLRDGGDE